MESKVTSNEKNIPDEIKVRILAVNWNENIIGYLMKENSGNYFFKYDDKGIQEARKNGYPYIIGFKDTRRGKVYASKDLFPVFKSRIPTKQRRDLDDILESYGMENYDEFDLLAFSGGRLFTDAISFAEYTPEILKAKRRLINNDITSKSHDEVESNGR